MSKVSRSSVISPEMHERHRLMSRMTPKEKQAYTWKCYDKKAKPQLLELIKHCQSDCRIHPMPILWNRIYHNYSWSTDSRSHTKFTPLKAPFLFNAWNTSNIEKRQRLLTQIYWCYKNKCIGSMHTMIMKLNDADWHHEYNPEDMISLELIKKEYASWLSVKYHPEHDIWNYCENHEEDYKQKREAEKLLNKKIRNAERFYDKQGRDLLDDESITAVGGML